MGYLLEVIGFTLEAALLAQKAGADRIELCDNPGEGGTTPSYGYLYAAKEKLNIPLYPMIRPRGGDFLYSKWDFEIMKKDMLCCKQMGFDGIVTGILNADGTVDEYRCAKIVALAYPMGVTFHRAFDRTSNPHEALETAIACGFERILTSGQQRTAIEGASLIASLIKQADQRIIIMPGSGITSDNILHLQMTTGAHEFHSSARAMRKSLMHILNEQMQEDLQSVSVNFEEIKAMRSELDKIHNENEA